MKRLLVLILMLVFLVSVIGCQGNEPAPKGKTSPTAGNIETDSQGIAVSNIDFERVKYDGLNADIQAVIDEGKNEKGYKLVRDESDEYYYLAVFSGQKPTAGYQVEITKVTENEGVTDVFIKEDSPAKGMMVAEVLTYPLDIVKLTGITDNINLIYITPKSSEGTKEKVKLTDPDTPVSNSPESSSTLLATEFVSAEYVGQIDNNSIEVKIEDGPQVFRLNGMSKEQLGKWKLKEGDIVKLEVFKGEGGQQTIYSMEK